MGQLPPVRAAEERQQRRQQAGRCALFIHWFTSNEAEWAKSAKVPAETEPREEQRVHQGLSYLKSFADDVPAVHFPPAVAGIGDAPRSCTTPCRRAVLGKKEPGVRAPHVGQAGHQIMADNKKKYG